MHGFPGFDRSRTGHATNPLSCSLLGVTQVRVGLGKRLAFHGYILADLPFADAPRALPAVARRAPQGLEPFHREIDSSDAVGRIAGVPSMDAKDVNSADSVGRISFCFW